jgi:hypothetical protein
MTYSNMTHLTEEQIVLHCYGDAADAAAVDQHLAGCRQCRSEFEQVKELLAGIPVIDPPEPPAYLEEKVWLNVRDRLPEKTNSGWKRMFSPSKWAVAGVTAVLVLGAFLAGRYSQRPPVNQPVQAAVVSPTKILLVAVGDHLDRSQMLLVEIMNSDSKAPVDFSAEQQQARNLLDANRLYRVSAQHSGDPSVARVLDDLERVLSEIANGPSDLSPQDVKEIREHIQSQDLLFKIHVIGSNTRKPAALPDTNTGTQRL